ncbi:unnamed protein product [Polarella glacialis]|uniref:Uncharacterized protein n=1 Tax=Polarella glacialis TaxID=89957 RepID=A0A813I8B8_POLGL|nr:unnamed protein product [Polarella glacialis]CAE8646824.1 unnamed protein product [Polarella glacialis]CAE8734583.1 unnamed protein product [Polarella glacialis]
MSQVRRSSLLPIAVLGAGSCLLASVFSGSIMATFSVFEMGNYVRHTKEENLLGRVIAHGPESDEMQIQVQWYDKERLNPEWFTIVKQDSRGVFIWTSDALDSPDYGLLETAVRRGILWDLNSKGLDKKGTFVKHRDKVGKVVDVRLPPKYRDAAIKVRFSENEVEEFDADSFDELEVITGAELEEAKQKAA